MPRRREPDPQPDLFGLPSAPAKPRPLRKSDRPNASKAIRRLDDAGLAEVITAAMAEARRRVRQAAKEERLPDPTLAQLIGQHQGSMTATSTLPQRPAEEVLAPAKENMVRAALEAGHLLVRVVVLHYRAR